MFKHQNIPKWADMAALDAPDISVPVTCFISNMHKPSPSSKRVQQCADNQCAHVAGMLPCVTGHSCELSCKPQLQHEG